MKRYYKPIKVTDWSLYDECGCGADAGKPCIDKRCGYYKYSKAAYKVLHQNYPHKDRPLRAVR